MENDFPHASGFLSDKASVFRYRSCNHSGIEIACEKEQRSQPKGNLAISDPKFDAPLCGISGRNADFPIWQGIILIFLVALLYRAIVWRMVGQWWTDPDFSHGFFVPLFSAYLIWHDRETLAQLPRCSSWWGFPITGVALLMLVVGVFGAELFFSRASLIVLFAGLVIFFAGWKAFRVLLFPWMFLFLMVPIPTIAFDQIALPLQFLASTLGTNMLRLFGVPVLREGNIIVLPNMPLEVAEACSGIRSLMSLATISIIYGYLVEAGLWKRVLLVLLAVPVAVAANAIRIFGTGLTVQYWDPDKAQGFFHEFSGWLIFVASLGMLIGLHALSRKIPHLRATQS